MNYTIALLVLLAFSCAKSPAAPTGAQRLISAIEQDSTAKGWEKLPVEKFLPKVDAWVDQKIASAGLKLTDKNFSTVGLDLYRGQSDAFMKYVGFGMAVRSGQLSRDEMKSLYLELGRDPLLVKHLPVDPPDKIVSTERKLIEGMLHYAKNLYQQIGFSRESDEGLNERAGFQDAVIELPDNTERYLILPLESLD